MRHIIFKGIYQDGETFYRDDMEEPDHTVIDATGNVDYVVASYTGMVAGDHDMEGARLARERFAKERPEFVSSVVEI